MYGINEFAKILLILFHMYITFNIEYCFIVLNALIVSFDIISNDRIIMISAKDN